MIRRSIRVIFIKTRNYLIYDIDVHKILIFKNEPYGRKNSGLNGVDDVIRPLCIKLYKMVVYVKCFDSNNTMSFKIKDNGLLKNTPKYSKKISSLMDTEFDNEPVYGDNHKYIKAAIQQSRKYKFSR